MQNTSRTLIFKRFEGKESYGTRKKYFYGRRKA
jgi:hypothetical protein